MNYYRSVLLGGTLWIGLAHAQTDSVRMHYANTISSNDLMRHLGVIASDAYEGREAGMKGQKMAAEYLREQFASFGIPAVPNAEALGLEQGYFQPFDLEVRRPGGIVVFHKERPYRFMEGQFYFNEKLNSDVKVNDLVVVAERTMGPEPFSGLDLKGKVVLYLDSSEDPEVGGNVPAAEIMARMSLFSGAAERGGAVALLFSTSSYDALRVNYAHYISSPRMQLARKAPAAANIGTQVMLTGPELTDALLEAAGTDAKKARRKARKARYVKNAPMEIAFRVSPLTSKLRSENVLAYIEGSDKREELVVVTAHYDHIGKDNEDVYNGADDDGSGTVALLEMAEAFAKAKAEGNGPRRSVLFMPVSAEEKGLLGSEYYSEAPVFPLENTIADLNIDMIGRRDSAHASGPSYVYVIGSDRLSTELHAINEEANTNYVSLDLDYTFNAKDDPNRFYYRSDHYNFARKGVPSIFYFSGVHEDYHGPGDEVEKILPDLLEQRTRLVFYTAWELANREQRIAVDRPEGSQ
jgi:Zn-dependent M28 family amino/carboxypeptidase